MLNAVLSPELEKRRLIDSQIEAEKSKAKAIK
jgi:hypothetical protein